MSLLRFLSLQFGSRVRYDGGVSPFKATFLAGLVKLGEALRGIEYCGHYYHGQIYLREVS